MTLPNRSGTTYAAPTDADRRPTLIGVSEADGITPLPLEVDPNSGALLTSGVSVLIPYSYDSISYTNTSTTVDTYKYFRGGLAGTLVATVTITYTDTTKSQISTVVRT